VCVCVCVCVRVLVALQEAHKRLLSFTTPFYLVPHVSHRPLATTLVCAVETEPCDCRSSSVIEVRGQHWRRQVVKSVCVCVCVFENVFSLEALTKETQQIDLVSAKYCNEAPHTQVP